MGGAYMIGSLVIPAAARLDAGTTIRLGTLRERCEMPFTSFRWLTVMPCFLAMAKLPIMYAPPIPITYRRIYHTVKAGETLGSIARRYRVSLEDMKRWNPKGAVVGQKVTMEVRAKSKGKPRTAPKGKRRS